MKLVKAVLVGAALATAIAPGFAEAARYGRGGGYHGGHFGYRGAAIGIGLGAAILASRYYAPRYYAPAYYPPAYYPPVVYPPAYYPPASYAPGYGYPPSYVEPPQQQYQPQYQPPPPPQQYQPQSQPQSQWYQPQTELYQPQSQHADQGQQGGNNAYFCASSNSYYPQARQCAEGWQQVDAQR